MLRLVRFSGHGVGLLTAAVLFIKSQFGTASFAFLSLHLSEVWSPTISCYRLSLILKHSEKPFIIFSRNVYNRLTVLQFQVYSIYNTMLCCLFVIVNILCKAIYIIHRWRLKWSDNGFARVCVPVFVPVCTYLFVCSISKLSRKLLKRFYWKFQKLITGWHI